ncbi:MAG: hypothetical protein NZ840_00765 [Anaerolineales bacterium]|nr:hypothetical protein [Anaerolineales bacterium]MDW8160567.1 hypothetical protein [Anaerolineales bacterium]
MTTFEQSELYEKSLALGRGAKLGEEEVFIVIAQDEIPSDVRLFWRLRVYDHYENGQWSLSRFSTKEPKAGELGKKLPVYPERAKRLNAFMFYLNQPTSILFLPSQPQWLNLTIKVEYLENPDGTIDLFAAQPKSPLGTGEIYHARSSLSTVTADQLREAGEDYPPWITERYLQLPYNLTKRTQALAQDLTKDLATPYDKAVAITDYLRTPILTLEPSTIFQPIVSCWIGFCLTTKRDSATTMLLPQYYCCAAQGFRLA